MVITIFGFDEFLTWIGSSASAVSAAYVGVATGPNPTKNASDAASMRLSRDGLRNVVIIFPTRMGLPADHCLHERQRIVRTVDAHGDTIEWKLAGLDRFVTDGGAKRLLRLHQLALFRQRRRRSKQC